jgi:hypothetical protein
MDGYFADAGLAEGGSPAQTPEAPFAVLLPLGAMALIGLSYGVLRRRHGPPASAQ